MQSAARPARPGTREIIVIGAGPGGLAAAVLLASTGVRVRVIERLPLVGGRTSTIEADGFRFDLGPTFFLYPRVLDEIFRAGGSSLAQELELIRLDPQYRLIFGGGGELNCSGDVARMEQEIARLAPRDAPGFARFLEINRAKLARMQPCLENPFESWRDLLDARILKLLPALQPFRSIDQHLRQFFSDPRVRLAFSFQAKYLGMSPFRCPSLFSILSFLEYEYGVFHPRGGCGAITQRLAATARRLGVEFHLDEPVERLLVDRGRAVGVLTARGRYRADAVVVNADFARAMTRLVANSDRRKWRDANIARKKFSCSTFMIYLGLKGRFDGLPHHNVYISSDYERNLHEIETTHTLSSDPSVYIQNPSVTDDSLAPRGMSTLYLLAPVTHQHPNVDWKRDRAAFRKLVLAQIAKAGFEDVERRVCFERVLTPADWDQRYEIHLGATFNLAHNLRQLLHLRPHNRFEDIRNVYLVGGGTHPGSGLPVIFESARISTRLLCADFGITPPAAMADVPLPLSK